MRAAGEETEIPAEIPGSVATALLACGRILDPYDRNHEEQVLPVFDQDYIFTKEFEVRPRIWRMTVYTLSVRGWTRYVTLR